MSHDWLNILCLPIILLSVLVLFAETIRITVESLLNKEETSKQKRGGFMDLLFRRAHDTVSIYDRLDPTGEKLRSLTLGKNYG